MAYQPPPPPYAPGYAPQQPYVQGQPVVMAPQQPGVYPAYQQPGVAYQQPGVVYPQQHPTTVIVTDPHHHGHVDHCAPPIVYDHHHDYHHDDHHYGHHGGHGFGHHGGHGFGHHGGHH